MRFNLSINDIKYVKILYKDAENNPVLVKAAIKKIDEDEFVACMRVEDNQTIPTPQEITLSIICQEGLYRTKTRLKACEEALPYLCLYMEPPLGLEYQQNREYFRIVAEYNCVYYVNVNEETKNFTAKTCDISANGVSFILPEFVVSEEDSEIEIMVEERLIHAYIHYVRSEKTDEGHRLSFMFTNISTKDRDYISTVCIQKQLELKRNSSI